MKHPRCLTDYCPRLRPNSGFVLQSFIALLIGLGGLMLAGTLLERIQSWAEFKRLPQLFVLVPIVLNLKGNLELNMVMRLSGSANAGHLKTARNRGLVVLSNLVLLQAQTLIVSVVAGLLATSLGTLGNNPRRAVPGDQEVVERVGSLNAFLLMVGSSLATTSLASVVMGSFLCAVIILCDLVQVDPDNLATPLAASLSDLLCLGTLSVVARGFLSIRNTPFPLMIVTGYLLCIPVFWSLVRRFAIEDSVPSSLKSDWIPLFTAVGISSLAGLALESSHKSFPELALLSPVLNGVMGNIGCIRSSKETTRLKRRREGTYYELQEPFVLEDDEEDFGMSVEHAQKLPPGAARSATSRPKADDPDLTATLYLLHFPILATFCLVASMALIVDSPRHWILLLLMTAGITVGLLVNFAKLVTRALWIKGFDPVHYAMPIISASADALGAASLVAVWHLFY